MARINILTAKQVAGLPPGRHSDGGNLYLVVAPSQTRRWAFIYRAPIGTQREMGLGSAGPGGVTLAMARELAGEARAVLQRGGDPIDARKAQSRANGVPTFGAFADAYIAEHKSAWKNEKHIAQWQMTLAVHAKPLRAKRLDEITTADVLGVLRPIWTRVPETSRRLRARIEKLLDAAKATGHRTGDNPARWRGHLDHLLPRNKADEEGHHAALPYMELPAFVAELRARPISPATLGLEYLILTAARTQEVLGAPWSELDIDGRPGRCLSNA